MRTTPFAISVSGVIRPLRDQKELNVTRSERSSFKYVLKQLNYLHSLVRAAPVMHGIVKDLTPGEIQAVAAYVQSK
jgi:cytochrome c553